MKLTINSRLHQYAAIILTIVLSVALAWNSAKSWFSYIYASDPPPGGLKEAVSLEKGNSEFYFLLGQYYDIYDDTAPREEIYELYKKALELNPLNYKYWISLARFLSKEGKREEALFALNQATELAPGVVSLRWGAGMLATELGDRKTLIDNLSYVIAHDPQRHEKAFIVLWQTLRNGDQILSMMPGNALTAYLNFLIKAQKLPQARKVWDKIPDTKKVPNEIFHNYVDLLMKKNELDQAKEVWANKFGDWNGIWNGDFENGLLNNGFDWTFSYVKGADIKRRKNTDNKGYSVEIQFDGQNNIDFDNFRQVIPVDEGSNYKLFINMKSKDLLTSNGLFWEINCPSNNNLYSITEEIQGTTEWRTYTSTFKTPQGCNFIVLRLRRYKSNKVNKNISGTLWIDEVALEKQR